MTITVQRTSDLTHPRLAIDYILHQAKRGTDAIGFLPTAKYWDLHHRNRLLVVSRDGQLVGFALHGPARDETKIYQAWIEESCRRVEHGRALIERIRTIACAGRSLRIALRCADDLPACAFWDALGFTLVRKEEGGARRGRKINRFELRLPSVKIVKHQDRS